MKKIMIIAIALLTGTVFAQNIDPEFEKQGELIKGTFFYDSGIVQQEGTYKDGKLHGEWKMYNEKGKKIALGEYNNGIKTGKWFFWDNDKLTEVDYRENSITDVTEWKDSTPIVSSE